MCNAHLEYCLEVSISGEWAGRDLLTACLLFMGWDGDLVSMRACSSSVKSFFAWPSAKIELLMGLLD